MTISLANMKISAVDGTAFVDFSTANLLTPYLNWKLTVYDSALRALVGYIKAAGTGETYGDELLSDGGMESLNWDVYTDSPSRTLSNDTRPGSAGSYSLDGVRGIDNVLYQRSLSLTNLALYYNSGWIKNISASVGVAWGYGNYGSRVWGTGIYSNSLSWVEQKGYFSKDPSLSVAWAYVIISGAAGNEGRFDDFSVKQVLTPSNSGVTICSAFGGSTQNWQSKDANFNYADSSGYTYKLEPSPAIILVANGEY